MRHKKTLFDSFGNPINIKNNFKGAKSEDLYNWLSFSKDINQVLSEDLSGLRARSRDLVKNDETVNRYIELVKQNVLGSTGINLQIKNKLKNGKSDKIYNKTLEDAWKQFASKKRFRGVFESPTVCGSMSMIEFSWLAKVSQIVDGEAIIQILRGYPHNKYKFALRLINPDLLTNSNFDAKNGNKVINGIEHDEYSRPVAYHFKKQSDKYTKDLERIPADQIIHWFSKTFVGQKRGFPKFSPIMHKIKFLNGVNEAVVVGWRVASSKMGFFRTFDSDISGFDQDSYDKMSNQEFNATPGTFETLPAGVDFVPFDPQYPTSTFESGYTTFMRQIANGLNISSPTLSNDYSKVNYSSLRQALLEDRDGWKCQQREMIDSFYQPIFEDWFDWSNYITNKIRLGTNKKNIIPKSEWQARGWAWVDPVKEVRAQAEAVANGFTTRNKVCSESTGRNFEDTAEALKEEEEIIKENNLSVTATTLDEVLKNEGQEDND